MTFLSSQSVSGRATSSPSQFPYLGRAYVVDSDCRSNEVWFEIDVDELTDSSDCSVEQRQCALWTVPGSCYVCAGDEVLVSGSAMSGWFVIGVIQSSRSPANLIPLMNGELVEVDPRRGSMRLLDSEKRTVIAYDASEGSIAIHATKGNVKFCADQGNLELSASGQVQVQSRELVEIIAPKLESDTVEVEMRTNQLDVTTDRTRIMSRKLELVSDTIMQLAKNAYATVAGLFQIKAGRSRTVIDGSIETKADKVNLRAQGDVKIAGKHIHLG